MNCPIKHLMVKPQRKSPRTIASPKAMLIVNDVDTIKGGHDSVGVKRQYAGSIGKVTSCQVGVDCVLAVPGNHYNADQLTWPPGCELYLRRNWATSAEFEERRCDCSIPQDSVPNKTTNRS